MKVVAENFTTDEKNISEMFTSVESIIASMLTIQRSEVGLRQANIPEGVMPINKSIGAGDINLSSVIDLASMKL